MTEWGKTIEMTNDTTQILATARDLAAYHTERMGIYRSVAELLRAAPAAPGMKALHAFMGPAGRRQAESVSCGELRLALVGASADGLAEEHARTFGQGSQAVHPRCEQASAPVRAAVFATAALPLAAERSQELLALSVLAGRTARALAGGEVSEAAMLCDLQIRFFAQHAGACLADFAAELEARGAPFYATLGRVLRGFIADDQLLLGVPDAPR